MTSYLHRKRKSEPCSVFPVTTLLSGELDTKVFLALGTF